MPARREGARDDRASAAARLCARGCGAFTAVVTAIVANLFTPIIGAISKTNFAKLTFTINGSVFSYGVVINVFITFIIVAATLFFLVVKPMNALRKRYGMDEEPPAMSPCPACLTSIVQAAHRCPSCTEQLTDNWATTPYER